MELEESISNLDSRSMLLSLLGTITLFIPTLILTYVTASGYVAGSWNMENSESLFLLAFISIMLCLLFSIIASPTFEGLTFLERNTIELWQFFQTLPKDEIESIMGMNPQERLQYVKETISSEKEFRDVHVSYYVAIAESLVLAFLFIVLVVNPPDPWSAFVILGAYFPLVIGIGLKITWQYARKNQSSIWRIAVHSVAIHSLRLIMISFLLLLPLVLFILIGTEATFILFIIPWFAFSAYLFYYQEKIRVLFRFAVGNLEDTKYPALNEEDRKKQTSLIHMIAPEWYVKSYSKFLWEVSLYFVFFVGMSILNPDSEFIQLLFYWIILFLIAALCTCIIDILKQKNVDRMAYLIFKHYREKKEWPNDIISNQLFELYDFNQLTKFKIPFIISSEKETSSDEDDSAC